MVRNMTSYRELARNHDFTILWVGETISELGSTMSLFVFPLLGYHLTGSTAGRGAARGRRPARHGRDDAAGRGAGRPVRPPAADAGRQRDRRAPLRQPRRGRALGALTVPHLAVVALLTGVAQGVFQPAQMAAIRTVVPTEDLPTAFSQNQARQHVASLLGGPLGGLLYAVPAWAPFARRRDLATPSRASR